MTGQLHDLQKQLEVKTQLQKEKEKEIALLKEEVKKNYEEVSIVLERFTPKMVYNRDSNEDGL